MEILKRETSEKLFLDICRNPLNINYNLRNQNRLKIEWEKNRISFREKLNSIDLNFLNNSGIGGLMFQSDLNTYNDELNQLPKEYYSNIVEYTQSNPNLDIKVSTNTIHHLFHLYKYFSHRGIDISKFKSKRIIEWGGGYGNMCKILIEKGVTKNYMIVDVPEFTQIQYNYLSSYFGLDNVNYLTDIKDMKDGINLISVDDIDIFPEYDTFISNWALTESSSICQDICINNDILNKNLILSYHQCGDHLPFMSESERLHNLLRLNNIHTEEVYFGGGKNYYSFK